MSQKVLDLVPDNVQALLINARLQAEKGELQPALEQTQKTIELALDNLQARTFLSRLHMAEGDLQKAEQTLIQTLALHRQGNSQEDLEHLEKALSSEQPFSEKEKALALKEEIGKKGGTEGLSD
ncbi:MAG: hypothetical protein U5L00_12785 [Desulfovermiculus sp.]|nr:hypothetical protein [Desulfovermiculus sp.]